MYPGALQGLFSGACGQVAGGFVRGGVAAFDDARFFDDLGGQNVVGLSQTVLEGPGFHFACFDAALGNITSGGENDGVRHGTSLCENV